MFIPKLIYNDGAAEAAAGGSSATTANESNTNNSTDNGNAPDTAPKEIPQQIFSEQEIKDFGFDSAEALKNYLRQQKENNKPDEEKQKEAALDKAHLIKYATENDLMKPDDFTKLESLQAVADRDLVYKNWLETWKEENADVNPDDIESLSKQDFEAEYKLNSENEKAKERGLAKLKKEADEIRSPLQSTYNKTKQQWDEAKSMAKEYPSYKKFIAEIITENTPDKIVVLKTKEGEDDIEIDVELSKEDKEEIAKIFDNNKNFVKYLGSKNKDKEFKEIVSKKINTYIKANKFDAAVNKAFTTAKGLGVKQGSNVGAENLYGVGNKKENPNGQSTAMSLEDSNKKQAQVRERYRNRR